MENIEHPTSNTEQRRECECTHWARPFNQKYVTNHHPNCEHYNDSLMDVWRVSEPGKSGGFVTDNEEDAIEQSKDGDEVILQVTKEKMHREVFENLPEFNGF